MYLLISPQISSLIHILLGSVLFNVPSVWGFCSYFSVTSFQNNPLVVWEHISYNFCFFTFVKVCFMALKVVYECCMWAGEDCVFSCWWMKWSIDCISLFNRTDCPINIDWLVQSIFHVVSIVIFLNEIYISHSSMKTSSEVPVAKQLKYSLLQRQKEPA